MDAMEAILSRRSIRQYTSQPVSEEAISNVLEAAMAAPSASNAQPWQFVVIRDRETLDEIPAFHEYSQMLKQAPLAILVCGDLQLEKVPGYWVQDCSAATQNLLVAAHVQGLCAVWLGIYPLEKRVAGLRKLLSLPENVIPLALIPIGHPAKQEPPVYRYDESRIHHDRW